MKVLTLVFCIYLCRTSVADEHNTEGIPLEAQKLDGEPLVEYLRKSQNLFEVNSDPTPGFEYKLMDMEFNDEGSNPVVNSNDEPGDEIPAEYDPRITWANCSSFSAIRDQANCGSCWAVSTAAAITDRICIATKGKKQIEISASDIMSCCTKCGNGCRGGWPIRAFEFFSNEGVVSGGNYASKGCYPYALHPCGQHGNETFYGDCEVARAPTPMCQRKCQPGYRRQYRTDKRFGKLLSAYKLPRWVPAIQREIMERGSVVATFTTYSDFSRYKSGIYKHTAGRAKGRHAVKIIGWGTENGTDYWIIANSWHDDWGEKGFFRMIRGIDDCGIESSVDAGLVDVDRI
ncbi:hypothetical protein V3C99_005954 [Haemonchus contortus]|uniref:Pept_C1 domain-containing protein n=1 Tax=Haemonchus contortus TaxID=6289 RepID=A0A7I4XUP0_HAECO|nr:Peptidase C1A domain containing protein [Haemonchus contortus]